MDVIALIAALVAIGALGWEIVMSRRDRKIALATAYLERYWLIDDDRLLAEKGSAEHRRHVHRYLIL